MLISNAGNVSKTEALLHKRVLKLMGNRLNSAW